MLADPASLHGRSVETASLSAARVASATSSLCLCATVVNVSYPSPPGRVAQSARALALHARGPGFESRPAHFPPRPLPVLTPLDLAYLAFGALTAPLWRRKARGDWPARFGRGEDLPRPHRPRLLLHAVSVGEVSALRTLAPLLAGEADLVISVGTDTGIARARELFADRAAVVRYPLDLSWCVRRFLDRVRPDAVGLVELELWPQFVKACERRAIPVAIVNGRLSERSFRRYRRARPLLRPTFGRVAVAAVQDDAYRERFAAMGVPEGRIEVTGTMKWDAPPLEADESLAAQIAQEMGIDRSRPLIVAGSTAPGEEALLHEVCPRGAQLLCAPRRPERFEEAAAALRGCVRRSRPGEGEPGEGRFLLDTIGELGAAYALADVVVMGRSFVGALHGSDPIEPAALGRPVLVGPAFGDFELPVRTLEAAGGLLVVQARELSETLASLLSDERRRRRMGGAAQACVRQQRGASRRCAELLRDVLARRAAPQQPIANRSR